MNKKKILSIVGYLTFAIVITLILVAGKKHNEEKFAHLSDPNFTTETNTLSNVTPTEKSKALVKAQNYLNVSAFSKEGLRGQLEYEGFTSEDIDYALNVLMADYNDQAAKKALQYQNSNLNLSKQGIYDQLRYEKFTPEQAQHGVNSLPE